MHRRTGLVTQTGLSKKEEKMFKKINRENKKGFTLAELLIVVAIIATNIPSKCFFINFIIY